MNKVIIILSLIIGLTACDGGTNNDNTNSNPPENTGPTNPPPTTFIKGQNFVTFETGQVRPLAKSPDGSKLFALNTPNSSLEIYSISTTGLTLTATVAVGLEPTAVAALSNNIVWVVNHLSDSVSIVDVNATPRVIQTLLVGDEPRDIIFAGTGNKFAFITTAHRGQNGPNDTKPDPQLYTPQVNRSDVWVFDTSVPGNSIGGDPVTVISLFGDTPRALTASIDQQTVYAAVFFSGNKTTTLGEESLSKPGPLTNAELAAQPDTGLIVQFDGTNWVDATGSTTTQGGAITYNNKVPFSLPDYDVFAIDASLAVPIEKVNSKISGVGTTLFNMITNPVNNKIYVSNTNALNLTRFEGSGTFANSVDNTIPSTVRGHFVESRISVINNTTVTSVLLNNHIDYTNPVGNQTERDLAISQPVDMAITPDGKTLYVAGFGTQNIVVYDTAKLEVNDNTPALNPNIKLSAGGTSGVVYDDVNKKLYVLTRFDNGISIIDTTNNTEISHLTMYNPEPAKVINGRPFLYNATATSSHGDSSCGLCHVYGDFDGLAWDLGNPDDVVVQNPNTFVSAELKPPVTVFHPMKGPMATQSFRGLKGNGPMHWRGDRVGASAAAGESLELGAFKDFNIAFQGLVGNDSVLAENDMQAFAEFALEITYPPNPIRNLDNSLSANEALGENTFTNVVTTGGGVLKLTCNECHVVDITKNKFGTAGKSTLEGSEISQQFKVPHLRNMYQKVGKFGNSGTFSSDITNYGPQIKGFGFMHDGGMDTLDKFFQGAVFVDNTGTPMSPEVRKNVIEFVMAMDSELAPIVGQQITLSQSSGVAIQSRIDLLRARALITTPRAECDLIVKGVVAGVSRSYLMTTDGSYQSDMSSEVLSDTNLRGLVAINNQTLTFTCVPPGSGFWMGIDHDEDGKLDRDEVLAGSDPLDYLN